MSPAESISSATVTAVAATATADPTKDSVKNEIIAVISEVDKLSSTVGDSVSAFLADDLLDRLGLGAHKAAAKSFGLAVRLCGVLVNTNVRKWEDVKKATESVIADYAAKEARKAAAAHPKPAPGEPKPDETAPTTEATSTPSEPASPKRRRRSVTPEVSRVPKIDITIPSVPPAPTVVPSINPAGDPLAGMALGMLPHFQNQWNYAVDTARHQTLTEFSPVMEKLKSAIEDVARLAMQAKATSVDDEAIHDVVGKALNNGAGEKIRELALPHIATAMTEIIEKAKLAISSTVAKEEDEEKLMAALEPAPDPSYAWDNDLEAVADLIVKQSDISPQNAMLVGPTGCGKTEFATQLAAKFGRRILVMDCGNIREGRDWFGQKGASNGSTWFRKSQFWLAVEAGGLVILMDEFNRVNDHVKNQLIPLLDHRRQTYVDDVQETLQVGPGTIFLSSLNDSMEYTGTHALDRAMENRFPRKIELSYLPQEKEVEVLVSKVDGLKRSEAKKLVELAIAIRQKSASFGGSLTRSISTRQLIAVANDFVQIGPKAFRFTMFNHFPADGGTDSERAQVILLTEGKFGSIK